MEVKCHCGNIAISVDLPKQVTSCNCSICSRYQTLWAYYAPGDVEISVAENGEQNYCWGDRELEFVRCAHCGCITHYRTVAGEGEAKVAVNFRMVDAELIANIPIRYFNGKELL
ncbi:hypothetical protein P886_1764 [Alteromonadaceae bacterium 2753L.S.0a.02]|nr:hypothetical protein P886_1764 [Alteromonadaceae bacterium 2753L.S.0a.02]